MLLRLGNRFVEHLRDQYLGEREPEFSTRRMIIHRRHIGAHVFGQVAADVLRCATAKTINGDHDRSVFHAADAERQSRQAAVLLEPRTV